MPKTILFTALNWGLGHASRSIPIIRTLQQNGHTLVLATDGIPLKLWQKEFPETTCVELPNSNLQYSKTGKLGLKLLLQVPRIIRSYFNDKQATRKIIKQYKIDAIISDNRFGTVSNRIPSYFISHQLTVKSPFLSGLVTLIHSAIINQFQAVFVPDLSNNSTTNLAGALSVAPKSIRIPIHYIGAISRFSFFRVDPKLADEATFSQLSYDYVAVLSGPEPQRTLLETELLHRLGPTEQKFLLIRGTTAQPPLKHTWSNLTVLDLANSQEVFEAYTKAKRLICRAGYTTILDLVALNVKALLIPTPGQTEQEYLGKQLQNSPQFEVQLQHELNVEKAPLNQQVVANKNTESNLEVLINILDC